MMLPLASFNSKFFTKPCKILISIFPIKDNRAASCREEQFSNSCLQWADQVMDKLGREMRSMAAERERVRSLQSPSPATTPAPNYLMFAGLRQGDDRERAVGEACRSFENYLVEMMVEEGKVRDLTDVEELLYCWSNLKSPVFVELVSRFYGELCNDLFSSAAATTEDEYEQQQLDDAVL